MAGKRVKPTVNVEPIKDLTQVNAALGELASLGRKLNEIENEMNEDIDRLRKVAEVKAAPHVHRIEALEAGLKAYADFNADLFAERKSMDLPFGIFGFRMSKGIRLLGKASWKEVLGLCKQYAFTEAIRFKEELDKEAMEKWPEERLTLVRAQRSTKNEFFYELKQEAL